MGTIIYIFIYIYIYIYIYRAFGDAHIPNKCTKQMSLVGIDRTSTIFAFCWSPRTGRGSRLRPQADPRNPKLRNWCNKENGTERKQTDSELATQRRHRPCSYQAAHYGPSRSHAGFIKPTDRLEKATKKLNNLNALPKAISTGNILKAIIRGFWLANPVFRI